MLNHNESLTYVNYMLAEHRRLHRLLRLARQSIAADNHGEDWTERVVKLMRDLRDELRCHFAQEEEGGCLDQAVSFQPRLSPDMAHVQQDHPRLLLAIDRLIAQAQDCRNDLADRMAIEVAFDELCRDLHAHEAAENDILRKGFGVDLEGNGVAATASGA
jgi:hemerythrin